MKDVIFKFIGKCISYICPCFNNNKLDKNLSEIKEEIKKLQEYFSSNDLTEMKRKMQIEIDLRSTVLDNLSDLVWAKDIDGKYLMTNLSFRNKFCYGLRDDEILGKTDVELAKQFKSLVGDRKHTFGETCFNSDIIVRKLENSKEFLEQGMINGKLIKLVVNKSPMVDNEGILYAICGTGRDVTDWYDSLDKAINYSTNFGEKGKNLLLNELNKLHFPNEDI